MDNKPKNYADKKEEGYYTVYVKDNKVVVTKHKDRTPRSLASGDKQEIVRCHPDDEFNLGEAVNIAVNRIAEDDVIRVGDTVKIINAGKGNAKLPAGYFKKVPLEYIVKFRYGVVPEEGEVGKVVHIIDENYVLIQTHSGKYEGNKEFQCIDCPSPVYVAGIKGLKKIKDGRFEE